MTWKPFGRDERDKKSWAMVTREIMKKNQLLSYRIHSTNFPSKFVPHKKSYFLEEKKVFENFLNQHFSFTLFEFVFLYTPPPQFQKEIFYVNYTDFQVALNVGKTEKRWKTFLHPLGNFFVALGWKTFSSC
jgi:hypothetical protein